MEVNDSIWKGKKMEIWHFLPYFLPPMNRPQNRPKGLTRLKFDAILYAYKRDKIGILSGIKQLNIFDTRKSFIRWDAPYSTNQSVKKKISNNPRFTGPATDTNY